LRNVKNPFASKEPGRGRPRLEFGQFPSRFRQSDGRGRPSHIVKRAPSPVLSPATGEALLLLREFRGCSSFRSSMKTYRKELWFEARQRRQLFRITAQIQDCLRESGVKEGLVLVNAMHITASVFINDNESGLHHDIEKWLEKLAPEKPHAQYEHNGAEDNADAHLKRSIMGREVIVAITNGKLDFGPWEEIFYGEFDGNRRKRVLVKIIGE